MKTYNVNLFLLLFVFTIIMMTYAYVCMCVYTAIAFSVPLTEEEESLVKRHPPKRLRMLEGQKSPPLTNEALQEKMAEAEQRRQQVRRKKIILL